MELFGKTQETLCCSFCGKSQNEVRNSLPARPFTFVTSAWHFVRK